MKKTLEIELMSDLCAGTGKGFAAVIDEDTAVDEYGIPFIPSKRIKGCLRELAKDIFEFSSTKTGEIFGVSGGSKSGTLKITDARIKDYDSQLDEIKSAISARKIKPNDITNLFCSVRAGTAIENDTVKNNSLRFVRVVNRTSPIDNKPLKFYADIQFDEKDEDDIKNLFSALRNIGYHRNRGLGSIRCSLHEFESQFELEKMNFDADKKYRISYLVYLQGDLMLPATDANHSLDYIPGTSVLGAFARRFNCDDFDEFFFSPDVSFGNLYISDKDGTDYMPAPGFLAKIKAATDNQNGIHNMIFNADEDEAKEVKPQYKPLKNGYIDSEKGYKKPNCEIVYHNSIYTKDGQRNKNGLFTQYCISSGQYFKGNIEARGDKAKTLYSLLESGDISFGRSKNSQYSHCLIKKISVDEITDREVQLKKGALAAYICESDVVLLKDGRYTVDLESFCEETGVDYNKLNKFTRITTRVVSGYNSKWNLKKPQFPVIKAGSCIVFESDSDENKPEHITIGAKQNEGYGRMKLIPDAKELAVKDAGDSDENPIDYSSVLLKEIDKRRSDDLILEKAIENGLKINLNASQIGRIILMCKESDNFEDFTKRIESIKTDSTRNEAKRSFEENKVKEIVGDNCNWDACRRYIINALTIKKYQLRGIK